MLRLIPDLSKLTEGQKWSLAAFAGLFGLPVFLFIGIHLYNEIRIAGLSQSVAMAEMTWRAQARSLDDRVEAASLKSPLAQSAYRLLADHDRLNPDRVVVLTLDAPLIDYKATKPPTEKAVNERIEAATAAIQTIGVEECKRLVELLAAECTVISADGQVVSKEAFRYQIQIAFRQKEPLGGTKEDARYDFVLSQVEVGGPAIEGQIGFAKAAGLRKKVYEDVDRTCKRMRRQTGTCSITAISISSQLLPGLPMARISASASFASLSPKDASSPSS